MATKVANNLKSVSFSKDTKNGKQEKRVRVEEINNGFLIIKNTEGKNTKGEYEYKEEKWFSETNPLEINTENKSLADLFD